MRFLEPAGQVLLFVSEQLLALYAQLGRLPEPSLLGFVAAAGLPTYCHTSPPPQQD